ncbi:hypothetical protein ACTHSL_03010 [Neisseria sp. P0008.S010]|jgi:hypothetical protein|uniref:hypothetical protein n=1 Tax=Neisseria sp. P0008.S010 TaxID=3436707 RepID=UPI003F81E9B6
MSKLNMKKYTVYFFTLQAKNSVQDKIISTFDFFQEEFIQKNIELSKPIELGENRFQLRNICSLSDNEIGGSLTRLREDVPPVGSAEQNTERDIELKANEGFLEKSHFIISKEISGRELISFQYAIEAGTVNTLGKLLQKLITHADEVEILEIIRQDAMHRVMNGEVRYLEYTIAKPRTEDYIAEDDFTKSALELMNDSNATKFDGKISIHARKKGLSKWIKEEISTLIKQSETTKRLKVKLNEIEMPIDILKDQIKTKISVEIKKKKTRRPETSQMLQSISTGKKKMYDQIKEAIEI